MLDGVEALKKYKDLPGRSEGKPVFGDKGSLEDIEGPGHETEKENKLPKQEIKNNTSPDKRTKRTCKYCDTRVYNNQTICTHCKEKRFKEIWEELLEPILKNNKYFVKKDVEDIDFPLTMNNSLAWYIENGYITLRKNGQINEYYIPTPEEKREKVVPGITKKCGDCKTIKSVDEFYKQKRSTDGYSYICKKCDKKRNQDRPRVKKETPTVKDQIQTILIEHMLKTDKKGLPIHIHLYLLYFLNLEMEGHLIKPAPWGDGQKSEPISGED